MNIAIGIPVMNASDPPTQHILLVEDEVIIALHEKRELERFGYEVTVHTTGEKALRFLHDKPNHIDLILSDIDLGKGIDGIEFASIVNSRFGIPIIFLTSRTDPETIATAEHVSPAAFLDKRTSFQVIHANMRIAFQQFIVRKCSLLREIQMLRSGSTIDAATSELEYLQTLMIRLTNNLNDDFLSSPVFTIVKDLENNIIKASEYAAELTGVERDEMEGARSQEIYDETAARYYRDDLDVIKTGRPKLRIYEPLPTRKLGTRWLVTDKYPHFDMTTKRIDGIVLFSTDVTSVCEEYFV